MKDTFNTMPEEAEQFNAILTMIRARRAPEAKRERPPTMLVMMDELDEMYDYDAEEEIGRLIKENALLTWARDQAPQYVRSTIRQRWTKSNKEGMLEWIAAEKDILDGAYERAMKGV